MPISYLDSQRPDCADSIKIPTRENMIRIYRMNNRKYSNTHLSGVQVACRPTFTSTSAPHFFYTDGNTFFLVNRDSGAVCLYAHTLPNQAIIIYARNERDYLRDCPGLKHTPRLLRNLHMQLTR